LGAGFAPKSGGFFKQNIQKRMKAEKILPIDNIEAKKYAQNIPEIITGRVAIFMMFGFYNRYFNEKYPRKTRKSSKKK
jgi:hypothetical protein